MKTLTHKVITHIIMGSIFLFDVTLVIIFTTIN